MKKALAKHISAVIHSNAMNGIMLFPGVNVFDKASVDAFAYNWANIWVETCKNNPLYWDNQFNRRSMSL